MQDFSAGVQGERNKDLNNTGPLKQKKGSWNPDILMAYWTSCRISPGDCENTKTSSQLPAEITQSAQTNTVVQSRSVTSSRRLTQIRIKTWPSTPALPQHSAKVPCYHGEKAKARASHCWAPSSGVSRTPSQRSDVTGASHRGHQSAACLLWPPQTLKQIEMEGERGGRGRGD